MNAASRVDDVAGAASGANRADDAASAGPSANRIDDALDNKPTESPAKPDTTPTTPADDHKPVGECSFTGDTLVLLADGSQVAISSVRVGGQVTFPVTSFSSATAYSYILFY